MKKTDYDWGIVVIYISCAVYFCVVVMCGYALTLADDVEKTTQMTQVVTEEPTLQKLPPKESNYRYLGTFACTGYCSCSKCCGKFAQGRPIDENGHEIVYGASGQRLVPDNSVAVDTSVIPFGSVLLIDGREYIAADTGAFSGAHIDFYCGTHEEALGFGWQMKEVYIKR